MLNQLFVIKIGENNSELQLKKLMDKWWKIYEEEKN